MHMPGQGSMRAYVRHVEDVLPQASPGIFDFVSLMGLDRSQAVAVTENMWHDLHVSRVACNIDLRTELTEGAPADLLLLRGGPMVAE